MEFSRCLWERGPGFIVVFTVLQLLTSLRISYEAAKKRTEPYTKPVEQLPEIVPRFICRQGSVRKYAGNTVQFVQMIGVREGRIPSL